MGCNSDKVIIERLEAFAGSTVVLMAMVKNADDEAITQADVADIRVDVYDLSEDPKSPVDLTGVEVMDGSAYDTPDADVVFDTPQTDSRWKKDSTGYNFAYRFVVPSVSDTNYEVRIMVTDDDGSKLPAVWEVISK